MAGKSTLDAIDQQILAELRQNARISHALVGERVRLSRNAVRLRIERLERDGHILSYTIAEPPSPQASSVSAVLLVQRHDRVRGDDVLRALRQIPEIALCDVVSGELDLVVRLEAADVERIQQIWQEVARLPGVRDITTALALATTIRKLGPIPA